MLPSALLRSWLVSASAAARFTLTKASSTSACPVVKAVPLARKPTSGIAASTMIRVRTVRPVIMRMTENAMKQPSRGAPAWRRQPLELPKKG